MIRTMMKTTMKMITLVKMLISRRKGGVLTTLLLTICLSAEGQGE